MLGDFEKDCKKWVDPPTPELSAELGAQGNLMTAYFNNFYVRGRTNKADLGLLLIKKQDSCQKKGIFDYFHGHTASLSLCSFMIMEWSCFCLDLPWVALSDSFWGSMEVFCCQQAVDSIKSFYPAYIGFPSFPVSPHSAPYFLGITLLINWSQLCPPGNPKQHKILLSNWTWVPGISLKIQRQVWIF